jgi:energy-coupling factor transporter transmembrane protein EcfT
MSPTPSACGASLWSPDGRLCGTIPLFLGPLLIQALQLAEELAEAMDARGFGCAKRTFLTEYRLKRIDWLAMGAGLMGLIGVLSWMKS